MQAAVLAHGIAENQPFVDGNKRTALAALEAFLSYNGYRFTVTNQELAGWILELSAGLTPEELAVRIRSCLLPVT